MSALGTEGLVEETGGSGEFPARFSLLLKANRYTKLMPSRPPETEFYTSADNVTLWRDVSRLFEDFCGEDESPWPKREKQFSRVLMDVIGKLTVEAFRL